MLIKIYTDGACKGNPGKGGAAFVVVLAESQKIFFKSSKSIEGITTNNRAEAMAIIMALEYCVEYLDYKNNTIEIISDSALLCNTLNLKWYQKWATNGWLNSKKEPVANQDLLQTLLSLYQEVMPTITKVKGHSGDKFNEEADRLASLAAEDWVYNIKYIDKQ